MPWNIFLERPKLPVHCGCVPESPSLAESPRGKRGLALLVSPGSVLPFSWDTGRWVQPVSHCKVRNGPWPCSRLSQWALGSKREMVLSQCPECDLWPTGFCTDRGAKGTWGTSSVWWAHSIGEPERCQSLVTSIPSTGYFRTPGLPSSSVHRSRVKINAVWQEAVSERCLPCLAQAWLPLYRHSLFSFENSAASSPWFWPWGTNSILWLSPCA